MKKRIQTILVFLCCVVGLVSCSKDSETPIGYVNFSITPNSTAYINLNRVGGYEYFIGGYSGVIVFRYSWNEFLAYERACPIDHKVAVEVDSESGVILECPKCGSQFVYTDGSPIKGPANSCLRQYATSYDGNTLFVYN